MTYNVFGGTLNLAQFNLIQFYQEYRQECFSKNVKNNLP